MLSLQSPSLHYRPPPFSLTLSSNNSKTTTTRRNPSSSSCVAVHAMDKDSQHFEVDPEKAKEALQKLDQQLQTLSKRQPPSPKIKASDIKFEKPEMMEEVPEISGSFLAYSAGALLVFTILYNVFFYAVIKPSIDGPESPASTPTMERESQKRIVLQLLPLVPEELLIHH